MNRGATRGTAAPLPLYDYRCDKGHIVEVLLRAGDQAPVKCEVCGKPLERLMGAPAKAKVRGGKRRRDIRFRKKGSKINLSREGNS